MSEFFNLMAANAAIVREPIAGETGVWVYSSETLISSAMKMSGVVVSGKSNSMTVLSKGKSYDTLVRTSARLYISAGGYIESTTVSNYTTVSNAGSAVSTFLSGGTMMLSNGGVASNTSIFKNGIANIYEGGIARDGVISSGGQLMVYAGGTALAVTSNAGAIIQGNGYIEYA